LLHAKLGISVLEPDFGELGFEPVDEFVVGAPALDGKNIRGVITFRRIGLVDRSLPWGA
jgi:hypothetical protein